MLYLLGNDGISRLSSLPYLVGAILRSSSSFSSLLPLVLTASIKLIMLAVNDDGTVQDTHTRTHTKGDMHL